MPAPSTPIDHSERDSVVAIDSYTTVLRTPPVPQDLFATFWRDIHEPLCSRVPGLGWEVQQHLDREQETIAVR